MEYTASCTIFVRADCSVSSLMSPWTRWFWYPGVPSDMQDEM